MIRTLKLIKLDCNMERFAEVFGDIIEMDDSMAFLKEALKVVPNNSFKSMDDCANPDDLFYAVDFTVSKELDKKAPRTLFGDRNYYLLRSFYRFCNDAYLWDDLESLERWAEELFDSLNGYNQKNFKPLPLSADALSRELLFLKFCDYMVAEFGETLLNFIVETVEDWRNSTEVA